MLAAAPPIRLAVDLSDLRPGGENGGIKPFLFETLLWLGRQRRAPLQFLYLTGSITHAEVREELARPGDEVICVRLNGGDLPRGDERVPRERLCAPPPRDLLERLEANVFYSPFGSVEFAAPGVSTICTVVDVLHRDFPWSLGAHHNAQRERTFQEILAVADALQCNSQHVVSRLQAHYGVAPEKMFTVYNAVHGRFAVLPPPAPVTGPLEVARMPAPFFLFPANAWKHKNHEALLVAYGMYRAGTLAAGGQPWPLVLTGHEDERWEELRALARTLGVLGADAVRFEGYVVADEFARLWEKAGALVFPSLHEGFGIPLLEAMEHDVPILCSREGSLPEVGADACLFVDARQPRALAEGMARLAGEPVLRADLIRAGRRRLADFSQETAAGHLLDAVVALSRRVPLYRPLTRGIFPDGWTEGEALVALPEPPAGEPVLGTLTLRFHPLPAPRRVRLRVGKTLALGSFALPAHRLNEAIRVDFRLDGGALFIEIPDAVNVNAADGRVHGVRLRDVELSWPDGQTHRLFAAP